MKSSKIALVFLLNLAISIGVRLNIHHSVTEVQEDQSGTGSLEYHFTNDLYSNMIDNSIDWNGTPFIRQEINKASQSLKGTTVRVRDPFDCDCQIIDATLVNPTSMLVENVNTGSQFYVDSRSIEYTSISPDNDGMNLMLDFGSDDMTYSGTLSYLMKGVSWSPTYNLVLLDDNTCRVSAYAIIRNNQQIEYDVEQTNLYSEDVQLVNSVAQQPVSYIYSNLMLGGSSFPSPPQQQIQEGGEGRGVYLYSLNSSYTLRPMSTIRLPFLEINPKCKFSYKVTIVIGNKNQQGSFQRNYGFKPDKYIPAGVITVREQTILIGQSNLPDTPQNFEQTITVSEDNDVRYSFTATQTNSSAEKEKPSWTFYSVDVTFSNYKDKDVMGVLEINGGTRMNAYSKKCVGLTMKPPSTLQISFNLRANDKGNCSLFITVYYG